MGTERTIRSVDPRGRPTMDTPPLHATMAQHPQRSGRVEIDGQRDGCGTNANSFQQNGCPAGKVYFLGRRNTMGSNAHGSYLKTLAVIGGACIAFVAYDVVSAQSSGGDKITQSSRIPPVGSVIAWYPNLNDMKDLAELPDGGSWVRCDGQRLEKEAYKNSPFYRRKLPNLNRERRFLRGGLKSDAREAAAMTTHTHTVNENEHSHSVGVGRGGGNNKNEMAQHGTHFYGMSTHAGTSGAKTNLTLSTAGTEKTDNRPINMSVVWIIRVK